MKRGKWKKLLLLMGVPLLALALVALDVRLKTVYYKIPTDKLEREITLALVTDLHSCNYGEAQKTLTAAIDATNPDILLLGGDIIDDNLPEVKAREFLKWAGENYKTYYVTGNHEYWTNEIKRLRQMVRDYGIIVLEGDSEELEIDGQLVLLGGINDREEPIGKWEKELAACGARAEASESFSILLSHRPEEIGRYLHYDFDLILAGHAHGGQWRIPGLINGVFAPNQGFFPKYAGGKYDFGNATMIVSRGLARESTLIPRIFNRPEYVVVKLVPRLNVK